MSIPISLYIHFPWCIQKCPYCDFNSHAVKNMIPQKEYCQRLLQDLERSLAFFNERQIHSIFMGGGTPSLFSPGIIAELLDQIQQRVSFEKGLEVTLEANPGSVDEDHFKGFREAGINRLSIGIQSFNPLHLKTLGRIHNDFAAKRAINAALNAGFTNFNCDLMHGLPNQTLNEALIDLKTLFAFNPPHLSWYQLTIEPNTLFYKIPPTLPKDDTLAEIQEQGEILLAQHGYEHYETSAFEKPGYASQHNLNYWQFGDYIGIGAGAHGKVTSPSSVNGGSNIIKRIQKTRQPENYLDPTKPMLANVQVIPEEKLPFEFMMNAMRLNQPILRELFETRTGLDWEILTPTLEKASQKKLIQYDTKKILVTELGQRFLNDLLEIFL